MRLILIAGLIAGSAYQCFSQCQVDPSILQPLKSFWTDHKDSVYAPGVQHFRHNGKEVVFFGTRHDLHDINHPMFTQLDNEISGFKPDIILVERNLPVESTKEDAALKSGDAGFCRFIGLENNIPVKSWDPSWNRPYHCLINEYPEEAVFTMVLSFLNFAYTPADYLRYEDFYIQQIASLETAGWNFRPEARQAAYFYRKYKTYFGSSFNGTPEGFLEQYNRQRLVPLYQQIVHSLQVQRDISFIKSLREALREHDRVFIQAGSTHLSSLKNILPLVLEKAAEYTKGDKPFAAGLVQADSSSCLLAMPAGAKEKYVKILAAAYGIRSDKNGISRYIRKQITGFKPDLILTQGLAPVYATPAITARKSGDAGLIRYLGTMGHIRVNSWEAGWDDVYYKLSEKYSPDDIYLSLLGWAILRESESFSAHQTFEDFFEHIYTPFVTYGYPFRADQLNTDTFLRSLKKYGKGIALYPTFASPVADPENPGGATMFMEPDGSYRLKGKPGKYRYTMQLCPPGSGPCNTTSMEITLADPDPSALVEITGKIESDVAPVSFAYLKKVLQSSIRQDILADMHAIRTALLLKVLGEYQQEYDRIFVQADAGYLQEIVRKSREHQQ